MHRGRRYIELLAHEWAVIDELCSGLTMEQWELPTELPSWSVKDVLSHIVGTEAFLLGRAAVHEIKPGPHVRNLLGEMNEREVDFRRARPGPAVLQEFRAVTDERLTVLRALSDEQLEEITWTPISMDTVAVFMAMRLLDSWVHEQDIRRPIGVPGHLAGEIPQHVFERLVRGLPKAVAKGAGAPDGSVVVFRVEGVDGGEAVAVGVEERRGRRLDTVPESPNARLRMDLETFVCLTCGRWTVERAVQEGSLEIEGDLGVAVAANMNGMF